MTSAYRLKSRLSTVVELGTAALAAGSAGFLAFAMPESIFSRLVVTSRLPQLLAAAQPPLGNTARIAAVAAVALVTFAFVWSLLRALDRRPTDAVAAPTSDETEEEAPRLRKADAHPDAPARRPILAGRELGEPADVDADEYLAEELAPEEAPEPEALPSFLVAQAPEPEPPAAEREPEPEATVEPWPWAAEEEPGSEITAADNEPEGDAEQEDDSDTSEAADLSQLMQRFETGLTRKQQAIVRAVPQADPAPIAEAPAAPAPVAAPVEEAPSDRVGHRLRSAIAELQKASGHG
jgi:hypothetical protein